MCWRRGIVPAYKRKFTLWERVGGPQQPPIRQMGECPCGRDNGVVWNGVVWSRYGNINDSSAGTRWEQTHPHKSMKHRRRDEVSNSRSRQDQAKTTSLTLV